MAVATEHEMKAVAQEMRASDQGLRQKFLVPWQRLSIAVIWVSWLLQNEEY